MKPAASVHRFRDLVAVRTGAGTTVYLTPRAAQQLSRAIARAARSVERERFGASSFGSVEVHDGDGWDQSGRDYEYRGSRP